MMQTKTIAMVVIAIATIGATGILAGTGIQSAHAGTECTTVQGLGFTQCVTEGKNAGVCSTLGSSTCTPQNDASHQIAANSRTFTTQECKQVSGFGPCTTTRIH